MDDESFVNNFVSNQIQIPISSNKSILDVSVICEVKHIITQAYNLNKQLKLLKLELENCDPESVVDKCELIEKLKNQAQTTIEKIQSDKLNLIKLKLKKRNYLKRKKKEQKKALIQKLKNLNEKRYYSNMKIESWMKEKQDEIEKEKQAKNWNKNADIILSDVKSNRSTAKKFLTLIKKLQDLKKVKTTVAKSQGVAVSTESEQVFDIATEKLKQNWMALDKIYSTEEKGLRLMIKDDEKKLSETVVNTFDDWEIALFGKKIEKSVVQNSLDFSSLRTMWDVFINIKEGTEIPVGWVVPHKLLSTPWTK